jgi:hypothetical protein
MSSCGSVVHSGTIRMVRSVEVPSSGGVVVMGTVRVTTLHRQEMGKPEFALLLDVVSSLSADSSRIVCSDGNPL